MIPKECKRLAEVDFPIAAVSAHSAREKSIRHGHPSTLHLWWARRPLAACRAMLMALLLPDPADPHCPQAFRDEARRILLAFEGGKTVWEKKLKDNLELRKALLHDFIAEFADWDNADSSAHVKTARALIKAAHGDTPLVVDPFAGGGSIPLEALRVGCDAFASDLNPVAAMINRVLLESIPREGSELPEKLRIAGGNVKRTIEEKLKTFYPIDGDGGRPISYLWARSVQCEQPNCGCEIPLIQSLWLAKKANRKRAIRLKVYRNSKQIPTVEFEIITPAKEDDVASGTVSRAKALCPACKKPLKPERVRAQLASQRGGAEVIFDSKGRRIGGARLFAVVVLRPGEPGRHYRLANDSDYAAVWNAQKALESEIQHWKHKSEGICPIPQEPTPIGGGRGAGRAFSYQQYGMRQYRDLFSARQTFSLLQIAVANSSANSSVVVPLTLALGKLVDLANANCRWEPVAECPRNVFGAGRVKAAWDFAEGVPISSSSGSYQVCVENLIDGVQSVGLLANPATVEISPAQGSSLPDDSASIWFTDPPYYDAYPYADLSDVFYVWFQRALPDRRILTGAVEEEKGLTPKKLEIVQDETRNLDGVPKDRQFFESQMALAFREGGRVLLDSGIGCVVFAHKTTEGWEALLSGMTRGGLTITASWPIATELAHRLRAKESAALATSVHLVCRRRDENAGVGDWGDIVRELPKQITDWMARLSDEGIHGADLVFACIGPALELYSKYARVETPDGEEVGLAANDHALGEPARRGFLSYVWEVAGRTALNQILGSAEAKAKNGAAGALEEDARLTALFLWTLQDTDSKTTEDNEDQTDEDAGAEDEDEEGDSGGGKKKGLTLIYDVARRFAQPLGIHLEAWEGRIIETDKGVVRLLPVSDRAKQLFGEEGASAVVRKFEASKKPNPQVMFDFMAEQRAAVPEVKGRRKAEASAEGLRTRKEATTLDRVHAAMLLQASGASNALRALLQAEVQRGPDFLRLANALSALYPRDSEEKRLLDAMLLAVPR